MRPRLLCCSVVNQLKNMGWHAHFVRADRSATRSKKRPGDDENVALGSCDIVPRVLLNLGPRARVLARILWHHVGQTERLRHGRWGGHVTCWSHVPTRVSRAFVVAQFSAFGSGQPCVGKKLVCSLFVSIRNAGTAQALGHKHRRLGLSTVQDGKSVIAKLAHQWRLGHDWCDTPGKKLRAIPKTGCNTGRLLPWRRQRLSSLGGKREQRRQFWQEAAACRLERNGPTSPTSQITTRRRYMDRLFVAAPLLRVRDFFLTVMFIYSISNYSSRNHFAVPASIRSLSRKSKTNRVNFPGSCRGSVRKGSGRMKGELASLAGHPCKASMKTKTGGGWLSGEENIRRPDLSPLFHCFNHVFHGHGEGR